MSEFAPKSKKNDKLKKLKWYVSDIMKKFPQKKCNNRNPPKAQVGLSKDKEVIRNEVHQQN